MNWDWTPGVRVGPFCLGSPLPCLGDVELVLLEPDYEDADWQTHRVGNEDARVSVRDGVVISVECRDSMRYLGGVELLGLSVDAVKAIFGGELLAVQEWSDGTVMYEAESLGLTLWVEDGHVASTMVEAIEVCDE